MDILRKLGVEDVDDETNEVEIKLRPRNAGISSEIDGIGEDRICSSPAYPDFQRALYRYNKNIKDSASRKVELKAEIQKTEARLSGIKSRMDSAEEDHQKRQELIAKLSKAMKTPEDIDTMLDVLSDAYSYRDMLSVSVSRAILRYIHAVKDRMTLFYIRDRLVHISPKLWLKFMKEEPIPVDYEMATKLIETEEEAHIYIHTKAKEYFIANIDELPHWVDFFVKFRLMKVFTAIIRERAIKDIESGASITGLFSKWGYILSSPDFMHHFLGSRLEPDVLRGDFSTVNSLIGYLSHDLVVSLIVKYIRGMQPMIARASPKDSVGIYKEVKSSIPAGFLYDRAVVSELVKTLDVMKAKTPILKGLTLKR